MMIEVILAVAVAVAGLLGLLTSRKKHQEVRRELKITKAREASALKELEEQEATVSALLAEVERRKEERDEEDEAIVDWLRRTAFDDSAPAGTGEAGG